MFKFVLLILAGSLQLAGANEKKLIHSPPPPSSSQIEACQRMALVSHPGVIEDQRVLDRREGYWIQYEIHISGGPSWAITCDLAHGSIISDDRLINKRI